MQKKLPSCRWSQCLVTLSGTLTFLLGFAALLGKQIPYLPAVQIQPTHFAMVYDTSFCFCIAGIAIFTAFFQRHYITKLLAIILIIIGALTGVAYIINVDWHITQKLLFIPDSNSIYLSKMRFMNAVCFIAIGLVFWRVVGNKKILTRHMILLVMWAGALLAAFAILCLFGYVVHTDGTYADGWGILAPMSTNTAIGFILLSIGIISMAANFSQRINMDIERALPIVITVFISLVSLLFWRFLITQGHLKEISPDLAIITVIKELSMSALIGIAVYFVQISRHHSKNAENLLLLAKNTADQLVHQATHDTLTGLANRFLFLDHIEQAIAQAKRQKDLVAVLFFDLDRFKAVNDSLGHTVGDALLKAVANRLIKVTRQEDMLARLGGDEFVLLALDIHNERNIIVIVEKYLAAFSQSFFIAGHELHLGCSVGISIYPKDGVEANILLKNADIAMYRAKNNKQPFEFYTEQMQHQIVARLSIENELRHALEKDEFILYYQPIINLYSGKISALEALIRWQSPSRGLVNPIEFIPIAEEMGIIIAIGEWVLRTACTQNKMWQQSGLLIACMSVNVAEKQIKQANFCHLITQILQKTALDPQYLALELTENVLMEDVSYLITVLQQLKNMNIKLSIDDFGTEYSSLNRLRHLSVDTLKIDQSFLREIPENLDDKAIVLTILAMAKNLNLQVIAEGVETKKQLEFLRANNCDEVQGYYFSKPLTAKQLEASIADLNAKIAQTFESIYSPHLK